RDAVLQQKRIACNGLPLAELQGNPVAGLAAPIAPGKQVLINPLVDKSSGTVVCVILILVSYKRLQSLQKLQPCQAKPVEPPRSSYSELDSKILQLCDDVSVLLQEIITEARNLSNAEICSVFLLDRSSHELVAKSYEIRIPADQGIAGHVATTGKILNIKDAYSHPLFYRGVDDSTGFRTRNILCFPIKDENQGEQPVRGGDWGVLHTPGQEG
ncbi:hypothetical protein E2320_005664, partial [Naja naja]